jgi:translation initiation factor 5B
LFIKMAPKKKPNKKGNDDWEAELGETVNSNSAVPAESSKEPEPEQAEDHDDPSLGGAGGGLLAALKKNKSKKQKKGKVVEEDFVDGEDPPAVDGLQDHEGAIGVQEFGAKAPEDATTEDLFAAQPTKAKGGKGKQGRANEAPKVDEDGSAEEGGGLKSKKEKEKEKKEREKQRKKEQVYFNFPNPKNWG